MNNKLIYSLCLTLVTAVAFLGCEEDGVLPVEIPTAISFHLAEDNLSVQPGGSSYDLQIESTTVATADRTYSITFNEGASTGVTGEYTLGATSVTIPAGELLGSTSISFDYDAIPLGVSRKLVFDLNEITDGSFTNTSRTSFTLNYSAFCPYNEVTVSFTFDAYPEEAYWQLFDNSDDTFLGGDGYTSTGNCYVDLTSSTAVFCLEDGEYRFVVGDCYGDGGTGFQLKSDGSVLLSSSGVSGYGEVFIFSLP
ncbi:hypothetical protein [Aestuariivivens sediminicola]|uniref:hypothetical protein n=1 Tax=Aestuariivivens sediminicola TaxID=2913560 RepID=UPI001F56FCB5|nr:hypothetical protein [Aestuariivivens sediminicola]